MVFFFVCVAVYTVRMLRHYKLRHRFETGCEENEKENKEVVAKPITTHTHQQPN